MQRSLTSLIAPFDSKYSLTKSCVYNFVSSASEKDGFVGVLVANLRFNVNNEKCDLVLQLAAFCSLPFTTTADTQHGRTRKHHWPISVVFGARSHIWVRTLANLTLTWLPADDEADAATQNGGYFHTALILLLQYTTSLVGNHEL